MTKSQKKLPQLTLHQLIIALSYWGSSVRIMLMGFLAATVLIARLLGGDTNVENEFKVFIYIVGSFALLDIGYVMLARALPLKEKTDVIVLLVLELVLAMAFVVPNFAYVPGFTRIVTWTILTVLLTLGVRMLLGLLFSRPKRP